MLVLTERAEAEIEVKRSRFIAIALPANTPEDVRNAVLSIRKEHPDANHVVHAAVIGKAGTMYSSSDDREPKNTAGRPALEVLKGSGVTDITVCIVRYFGGTLLGTGGLVHAYGETSKLALEGVARRTRRACAVYRFTLDYGYYSQFENKMRDLMAKRPDCEYSDKVDVRAWIPVGKDEEFERRITDLTERHVRLWKTNDEYI